MNIETRIGKSSFNHIDYVGQRAVQLRTITIPQEGLKVIMSDGEIKEGFEPNLMTRRAVFDNNSCDLQRFYCGDGKNFFISQPYFFDEDKIFVGYKQKSKLTLKLKPHISTFKLYQRPVFTIDGLYKENGVKESVGFFKKRDNKIGKINFLEQYLTLKDKSGFKPCDMIVKNQNLRLKLLEINYVNKADYYASKFI